MKVAIVQNNPVFGKKNENIRHLLDLIDKEKADIYILPELAYTGYQFVSKDEVGEMSDTVDSDYINVFKKKSIEKDCAIVFGFAEKGADGKTYNSSILTTPESYSVYRKTHLFYKEKLFFSPGNTGFVVHEWKGAKIGLAICFDWFFSESFRTLSLMGADIIAHCSNLVMPYCQTADYARAIENRVYIATCNRIGSEQRNEEKLTFTGQSVLVSPKGEYLIKAPEKETGIYVHEIDTSLSRNKQLNEFNHVFEDRREVFYFKK
jgi:predicted amidohydrolase